MKYFISTDGDSNQYVVPTEKEKEWDEWVELCEDGEYHPEPEFAIRIEGGRLYFDNPFIDGENLFS